MATVNWPDSPSVNDEYVFGSLTFKCVAVSPNAWELELSAGLIGTPFTLLQGPFMTAYVLAFPEKFSGGGTFTLLTHI